MATTVCSVRRTSTNSASRFSINIMEKSYPERWERELGAGKRRQEEEASSKASSEDNKGLLEAIRDALWGQAQEVRTSSVLKEHPVALSS